MDRSDWRETHVFPASATSENLMAPLMVGAILALMAAEGVLSLWGAAAGGIFHAILLLGLVNAYAFLDDLPNHQAFLILALVPLMRILSLTVPIPLVPPVYWYAMAGAPMLLAIVLVNFSIRLDGSTLRYPASPLAELGMALTGIPISLSAYAILRPRPIVSATDAIGLFLGVLFLAVFGAFIEELIFRGLLLSCLRAILGAYGILYGAMLFASLYLSSQSVLYIILAGAIGLLYTIWVERTHNLWGVVFSHAIWYIGLILVWPLVLH